MMRANVIIGERGQVVIPARLRKELRLIAGNVVTLSVEGDAIKMVPKLNALRAAQTLVKGCIPAELDLVSELIRERRREAARELKEIEGDDDSE